MKRVSPLLLPVYAVLVVVWVALVVFVSYASLLFVPLQYVLQRAARGVKRLAASARAHWSGRLDEGERPLAPQPSALPGAARPEAQMMRARE
jgi:hypothetical protein